MKILKFAIEGLPNFKNSFDIDFVAQQRVDDDDKERLYNIFSSIYLNQTISFIGINASGKTTILKVFSFVVGLLNNKSLNNIKAKDIFDDLGNEENAVVTAYFYHEKIIYKLQSIIVKRINEVDGNEKLIIVDETLWAKEASKVKTKKSIYDFKNSDVNTIRNQNEQYLLEDVSIMVALNKKENANFLLYDTSLFTNYNMLNVMGNFPKEILTFLDSSIEYLHGKTEGKKEDIRLKFYGKDEIILDDSLKLDKYLSSGTIKGLSVFIGAIFAFTQGGYLVVDELENHFNKEIVTTLIRFFMDKKINKYGATLIFSTHYSELLDQFERNDGIYIVRNTGGITAENLSNILRRNDIKKSEVYDSDFLQGTVPSYESYIALKKVLMSFK